MYECFAKFDEIPSMTLQDIKETKRYRHTFVRLVGCENSIPPNKHSLPGYNEPLHEKFTTGLCVQRRLKSASAAAQSDQKLCYWHEVS